MALQLVLDENGNYTHQDPRTVKPRPIISNEFEAYEPASAFNVYLGSIVISNYKETKFHNVMQSYLQLP